MIDPLFDANAAFGVQLKLPVTNSKRLSSPPLCWSPIVASMARRASSHLAQGLGGLFEKPSCVCEKERGVRFSPPTCRRRMDSRCLEAMILLISQLIARRELRALNIFDARAGGARNGQPKLVWITVIWVCERSCRMKGCGLLGA